jgi:hypothetical protein
MVGEIKVIFTPDVIDYLDVLVRILYKKEYFGYIETAEESVPEKIKWNMHKPTPKKLQYLGSNYVFYKANARTTWYILFEKQDAVFLITGILNNHCEEIKYL